MLWSGLVSRVGASHWVNLIAPFPWTELSKKNYYDHDCPASRIPPPLLLSLSRQTYNLGQYKMEQLSPISPKADDEGAKEQEARHFGIIEMGGGVVQMSH